MTNNNTSKNDYDKLREHSLQAQLLQIRALQWVLWIITLCHFTSSYKNILQFQFRSHTSVSTSQGNSICLDALTIKEQEW